MSASSARYPSLSHWGAFTAVIEAGVASRAKTAFLANMSHELRTPLNAIIGFSEIMRDEVFGPVGNKRYRDYATDIHDSGAHLLGIVNDILDLVKVETGALTLVESEVSISAIVERALRLVESTAKMPLPTLAPSTSPKATVAGTMPPPASAAMSNTMAKDEYDTTVNNAPTTMSSKMSLGKAASSWRTVTDSIKGLDAAPMSCNAKVMSPTPIITRPMRPAVCVSWRTNSTTPAKSLTV